MLFQFQSPNTESQYSSRKNRAQGFSSENMQQQNSKQSAAAGGIDPETGALVMYGRFGITPHTEFRFS